MGFSKKEVWKCKPLYFQGDFNCSYFSKSLAKLLFLFVLQIGILKSCFISETSNIKNFLTSSLPSTLSYDPDRAVSEFHSTVLSERMIS